MPYKTTTDYTGRQVDLAGFHAPALPQGQYRIQLNLATDGVTQQVAGIQKLVQRYVNLLLTVKGGVVFDPIDGSTFLQDIHLGGTYTAEQLLHSFVFANAGVLALLRSEDADPTYGTPAPDEMIADARILSSAFDNTTGTLNIKVRITSRAGDNITFVVPVSG